MKLTSEIKLNLKTEEVKKAVEEANRQAMRDTVVDIWNDSVHGSPKKTGHNMRSLAGEVSGMGTIAKGADAEPEKVVDDSKIEGAVYSTSGYGGYLETGTVKMSPRPYMKPSMDKSFTAQKFADSTKRYLK
jgi:membrane protein involved in colicin uptake